MATSRIEELLDHQREVRDVAVLRWLEWGGEPGSGDLEDWVAVTERECRESALGRDGVVPITLIARDDRGAVAGAVGLAPSDPEGLADRGPWVVGTVVRGDCRGRGVGRDLMAALHLRASSFGTLWVSTQRAAAFYSHCGYQRLDGSSTVLFWAGAPDGSNDDQRPRQDSNLRPAD